MKARLSVLDITGTIDVGDPEAVGEAVAAIFYRRYPGQDFAIIAKLYNDFGVLYRGELPGFLACDTSYHDMQHVLDVSLAMARLLDGYEIDHAPECQLGPELALMGLVVALFHDSGYIRRAHENVVHGAEYTKIHVSRSAQFMAEYLPTVGLASMVHSAGKLVHFTGYEYNLEQIELPSVKHRVVGALVGTADVIAQMADPAYLEKCRDRLYPEFELGGIARRQLDDGSEQIIYESAEDLLIKTPQFMQTTITGRLEGQFDGLYHHIAAHFGGDNPYMNALEANCRHLEELLKKNDPALLHGSALRR